jgi:hypothetical protein
MSDADALVILAVKPDSPFCIEEDAVPRFRLAFFDFTGSGHVPVTEARPWACWSHKVLGKGEGLAWLDRQVLGEFDYIAVIDHDVMLSISAINRLLFIGRIHRLDLFQPSLAHDSYISHSHLAQRPGILVRETTFVEVMTSFLSAHAYALVRDLFPETISGYGIDIAWSQRIRNQGGRVAVIDGVPAKHLNPVTSPTWRFPNGETSLDELHRVIARHGLAGYELK